MLQLDLQDLANLATIAAGLSALLSLPIIAWQVYRTSRVHEADFLLKLEEACTTHHEVIKKIESDPDWCFQDVSSGHGDLFSVENYLAFFEYCELLIRNGAVKEENILQLFGYRIQTIARNKNILSATTESYEHGSYWGLFSSILKRASKFKGLER